MSSRSSGSSGRRSRTRSSSDKAERAPHHHASAEAASSDTDGPTRHKREHGVPEGEVQHHAHKGGNAKAVPPHELLLMAAENGRQPAREAENTESEGEHEHERKRSATAHARALRHRGVNDMAQDRDEDGDNEAGGNHERRVSRNIDNDDSEDDLSRETPGKIVREGSASRGHAESPLQDGVLKKKVSSACAPCKAAHAGCDLERPCGRCVRNQIVDLCHDLPAKKRGRKPKYVKQSHTHEHQTDEADAAKQLGSLGTPQSTSVEAAAGAIPGHHSQAIQALLPLLPSPVAPTGINPTPVPASAASVLAAASPVAADTYAPHSPALASSSSSSALRASTGRSRATEHVSSPMAPLAVVSAVVPHMPTTPHKESKTRVTRSHSRPSRAERSAAKGGDSDSDYYNEAGERETRSGRTSRSAAQRKRARTGSSGVAAATGTAHSPTSSEGRERVLSDVNRLLMDEIQELKAEQEKLYDEVRMLRERSSTSRPALMARSELPAVTHQPAEGKSPSEVNEPPKAIVIFDLTKKPVQVMTVNDAFCSMLGYSADEVLGESWHKFIPPGPYVDRAMNILAPYMIAKDKQGTATVKFEQVYRHKNGSILRTVDTHNILFGAEGQPTQNFVTISPLQGVPAYEDVSLLPPLPMPNRPPVPALEQIAPSPSPLPLLPPGTPLGNPLTPTGTPFGNPPTPTSALLGAASFGVPLSPPPLSPFLNQPLTPSDPTSGGLGSSVGAFGGTGLPSGTAAGNTTSGGGLGGGGSAPSTPSLPPLPSTPSIIYSYTSLEGGN